MTWPYYSKFLIGPTSFWTSSLLSRMSKWTPLHWSPEHRWSPRGSRSPSPATRSSSLSWPQGSPATRCRWRPSSTHQASTSEVHFPKLFYAKYHKARSLIKKSKMFWAKTRSSFLVLHCEQSLCEIETRMMTMIQNTFPPNGCDKIYGKSFRKLELF